MSGGLSVRQTEELVRRLKELTARASARASAHPDPDLERLEADLRDVLGTKVTLTSTARTAAGSPSSITTTRISSGL